MPADWSLPIRYPGMRSRLVGIGCRLAREGYESVGNTPAEYEQFMRDEVAKWAKVIKEAGIKMEE
jgi:hypothetical protein